MPETISIQQLRSRLKDIQARIAPLPWRGDSGDGLLDAEGNSIIWDDSGEHPAMVGRTQNLELICLAVNHLEALLDMVEAHD